MANQKLYKGSLQTIILKLLENQEKMYGYEITQKVKDITQGALTITEGALYPALHKLEAEGLPDASSPPCEPSKNSAAEVYVNAFKSVCIFLI